jgi:hypothetical protein
MIRDHDLAKTGAAIWRADLSLRNKKANEFKKCSCHGLPGIATLSHGEYPLPLMTR